MRKYRLRVSGKHYNALRSHLFPGDGLEAVAFLLCGRRNGKDGTTYLVHEVVCVPYEVCDRRRDSVTWKTDFMSAILDRADLDELSVFKVHSHTSSFETFSSTDDYSDNEMFRVLDSWGEKVLEGGSLIMLPDGRMFGRVTNWTPISEIAVAGNALSFWRDDNEDLDCKPEFAANEQVFGSGTTRSLSKLRIAVVGCSGTGSVVIEQLARLGVANLVLVDHDRIEARNLNRIINAKKSDLGRFKADVIKAAIESHNIGTKVEAITKNLFDPGVVERVAECDVVFGCMDTAEGRHLLNRVATFYLLPYFDLGVHLAADGIGGITEASGVVHYIEPGRSSLFSRGAYGLEQVKAEGLKRTNPAEYEERKKINYIEGVDEQAPAVISVNTTVAGIAVNEFLSRLHSFRSCDGDDCSIVRFSFMETLIIKESEGGACDTLERHVGRGDIEPTLGLSSLSKR
jgi:hypothetical protein